MKGVRMVYFMNSLSSRSLQLLTHLCWLFWGFFILSACTHSKKPQSKTQSKTQSEKYRFIQNTDQRLHMKSGSLFSILLDEKKMDSQWELTFRVQTLQDVDNAHYTLSLPEGVELLQGELESAFSLIANTEETISFRIQNYNDTENIIFHVYTWEKGQKRGKPFVWSSAGSSTSVNAASQQRKATKDRFKKIVF